MIRPDETWHRLRDWTYASAQSERLAVQVLLADGFTGIDPSHPLGGPDGGRDAICNRNGQIWIMAVYFPKGQQTFRIIKEKFASDVKKNSTNQIVFVTNQELTLAQRSELRALCLPSLSEIYHLERVADILDQPHMASVRQRLLYLDRENHPEMNAVAAKALNLSYWAFLCDRIKQWESFKKIAELHFKCKAHRPLVLLAHGASNQDHFVLIQKLLFKLKKRINLLGQGCMAIDERPLDIVINSDWTPDDVFQHLRDALIEWAGLKIDATDNDIAKYIIARRSGFLFSIHISAEALGRNPRLILFSLFEYWRQFSDIGGSARVIFFIFVAYEERKRFGLFRLLFNRIGRSNKVRNFLKQNHLIDEPDVTIACLQPEIGSVRRADLDEWIREVRVHHPDWYPPTEERLCKIMCNKNEMPMQYVVAALSNMLHEKQHFISLQNINCR